VGDVGQRELVGEVVAALEPLFKFALCRLQIVESL
jgi:hypothetical protein